jgi:GAF domain-containing protein
MPEETPPARTRTLGRDILRAAGIDLAGRALVYVGGALLALLAFLVVRGGSVPAWSLVAAVVVVAAFGALARRRISGLLSDSEADAASLEDELAHHTEYSRHLENSLDTLQRVVSGDIEAKIPYYIEQAVLAPARDILTAKPAEHVRLSVLLPDQNDDSLWSMPWAAGHSLAGQLKYNEPIRDTLSRHALETGAPQYWPDVQTQTDFQPNPLASAPIRAMVSVPIFWGDETVGVFNAVSAEPDAFDEAEQTFLRSLGGVIAVAVSVWLQQPPR